MKTTNSFRSKLAVLMIALVASVSSYAKDGYPDFQVDELYYNFLEGDSVQVTFLMPPTVPTEVAADTSNKKNVSGAGYVHLTEIVIPSTVIYEDKTYHVTRIGHGAFMYCPNLMHIDLPTSIKSIGEGAFHNCRYLSSITLNEGLESIEQQAFWGCPTLKEVSLPSTLKSLKQKVFYDSKALSKVICKALVPPSVEKDLLTGTDNYNASIIPNATLYVPAESLEAYKTAAAWKDFGQILPITWSEECYEYRDFNLTIQLFPRKSSLVYTLYHTDDRTIEPPYVDSVWILDPELDKQNPLHVHTLYAQPGDTIDLSFLEKNKPYILKVHINECQMSRVFPHRVVKWEYKWCNKWNVMWFDGMRFDETARTSKYRLGKDTVIGDYTYRKFTSRTSVRFTEDWKVYVYYEGFDDNDPYTPDLPTGEYLAYDFSAQVGDTLEVFSGIRTYSTYPCIVDEVQTDPKTGLRTITLHKICRMDIDGDGIEEDYDDREMRWIEGVGSPEGFLISDLPCGWVGGGTNHLLCAYKDDELIYTDSFYERFGCEYNAGVVSDDLFPTLSGLQRTICREYCEQADNKTRIEQFTNLTTRTETGAPYIYCSPFLLREKDNKIMIYSRSLNKDLVLYDFNLQVGDSLPMLYIDTEAKDDWIADRDMDIWYVVDYHKDLEGNILPADTLIVTDVSMITLLDGKEYKKWTFNNGMEYVEGIGSFGNGQWSGDFFQLIANKDVPTCLLDEHLVCASKNGKLLYQMDDAEMERLGTECLCEIEPKWSETWCNQWNILSHGYFGPQDPLAGARTSIYWLSNNTVNRNGQEYIPLMCSSSLPNEESTHLVGELRFTEDKQVYFYYAFDETEYLLYDFGAELGDTLELFAGLEFYNYHKTYTHVITDKETLDDGRLQIQADVVIRIDNGAGEYFEEKHPVTWIEGLGSTYGIIFNPSNPGVCGDGAIIMLCAYRDDECVYTTNFSDYKNMGCVYNNDGTVDEDLFPMLAGLQRTVCNEYCEDSKTSLQKFEEIRFEHDQPYIYCYSAFLIREENNKILIYSHSLDKDLVLYDFTLEVGDSLPRLYLDESAEKDLYWIYYDIMNVVDYHKDDAGNILPADTLIVTDVSAITLLDGKEYKKWTFNNGMEYVEGIGSFGNNNWSGDFFRLIGNMGIPACLHGEHLVCVSKNNKLLYQMDDAEMERLGTECLCQAEQNLEDLFPTLWGMQRTEVEFHTDGASAPSLVSFNEYTPTLVNGKWYLYDGRNYLREENNQVLLYAPYMEIYEDVVLYDWALEVGDTLPYHNKSVYRKSDYIVTDVSTITLLDGKKYKKWTLACGYEYIESIGAINGHGYGLFLCLPHYNHLGTYIDTRLVCASRNGHLLYKMDDAEMEQLETECLCEYNDGPKKDNAKDGKIGGRPTPTQWNMLEMVVREMENNKTILQAETFSYTLEDNSRILNNKTYFDLARQSTRDTAITKSVVGALHFSEDEGNRVYFLCDGMEYLLYDFTAEPGDSIEIFAGINTYPQATTYTHVVTGKDTLENGACRMILEVVFPNQTGGTNLQKVWLAGLGSLDGIVHNSAQQLSNARSAETESSVMLCAWREDDCLYTTDHPEFDKVGCVYNLPTAVDDIQTPETQYQKIIHNGHLYILRNNKIYDVLGTPLN